MAVHLRTLIFGEAHEAPSSPGVYAWYAVPSLSAFDIADATAFQDALLAPLGQANPPEIQLAGSATYGAGWNGSLQRDEVQPPEWSESLAAHSAARALVREFFQKDPIAFLAPLYIGRANNLAQRLGDHEKALDRAYDNRTEIGPEADDDPGWFAARVAQAAIPSDALRVQIASLTADDGLAEARSAAALLEWHLHRFTYPLLGRR